MCYFFLTLLWEIAMRPKDVATALAKLVPLKEPVMLWSAPGVGKTAIATQTSERLKAPMIISHPVTDDPTDAKGLPFVVDGKAEFLPFGQLQRAMDASELTVWLLDDLGQAVPAVQAAYMQLILGRRLNGHKLSDDVVFVAASNRQEDRAGVHKLITPLANRFSTHLDMEVSKDDWQEWALEHGIAPEIRGFINFRPDKLHSFRPDSGDRAFASPRSWEKMSKILSARLPDSLLPETAAGCVGTGPAAEFMAFMRTYLDLPDIDEVLANPSTTSVPGEPSVVYALCGALSERLRNNPSLAGNYAIYASRMGDAYATVAFTDGFAICPQMMRDQSAMDWCKEHRELFFDD